MRFQILEEAAIIRRPFNPRSYLPKTDSPVAIAFSWHVASRKNDNRWGSTAIGSGNEFKVAVLSVKNAHPEIPIYLFTNSKEIDPEVKRMLTVINEGGLYDILEETQDSKVGFGTKPQALIHGFSKGILPDKVLYLDIDVIIADISEEFNLMKIFEPLEFYDMAGVFEGFAIGPRPTPAAGGGWEVNTGVLAVRKQALPLLREWLEVFKKDIKVFGEYLSGEQQALMVTLQRNPKYRIFPLPSVYNFRRPALWSVTGPHMPVVIQSHIYSDSRMKIDEYKAVAKHSAAVSFEDMLHHMTLEGGPMHYLCDAMAG
eukprot:gene5410-10825_t